MNKHILCVDDESSICDIMQAALTMEGYRVSTAESGETARRILKSDPPDLIIMDQQLEDTDGLTLSEEIRKTMPDLPILLLTGLILDSRVSQDLSTRMISSYLPKTSKLGKISNEIRRLLSDKPAGQTHLDSGTVHLCQ